MIPLQAVRPENLLGRGSESSVYALGAAHVVRVYRPGVDPAYLAARQTFYAWLHRQGLPFATPQVLDTGWMDGQQYSVEARMPGQEMAQVLPTLRGPARAQALRSFAVAAAQLGTVYMPAETPYGELVAVDPVRRADWREFLIARIHRALQVSGEALARDVPDLPACIAAFEQDARALPPALPKRLVHGDYFPANVFIGDDLTITGVGDFSYATVAGDPRIDLMGALCFIELAPGYEPADSDLLREAITPLHGADGDDEFFAAIAFYRRYAAFVFSPSLDDDPDTYAWCVATLAAS